MPILGLIDAATFNNAVGVTSGSATVTKNAADSIDAGDIIELSGVRYFVNSVDSDTLLPSSYSLIEEEKNSPCFSFIWTRVSL